MSYVRGCILHPLTILKKQYDEKAINCPTITYSAVTPKGTPEQDFEDNNTLLQLMRNHLA